MKKSFSIAFIASAILTKILIIFGIFLLHDRSYYKQNKYKIQPTVINT